MPFYEKENILYAPLAKQIIVPLKSTLRTKVNTGKHIVILKSYQNSFKKV